MTTGINRLGLQKTITGLQTVRDDELQERVKKPVGTKEWRKSGVQNGDPRHETPLGPTSFKSAFYHDSMQQDFLKAEDLQFSKEFYQVKLNSILALHLSWSWRP